MEIIQKFVNYFITMFVIIDPIGVVPIFISITAGVSRKFKKIMALRSVLFSSIVVILFFLFGDSIIKIFSIDINAFKVAGGIVLFILAMEMLFAGEKQTRITKEEKEEIREQALEEQGVWVVPLSIPALTGPVTMSSIIIFTSQENSLLYKMFIPIACILVLAIAYYFMIFADRLIQKLGTAGINAVSRIMGIILLSISIKVCISGVKELWKT
ncbi:MAG: MarC family protein [Candidatus Calescibacterium sp.]|nr:MarC family protein [Candidatus Calescibacterium sp.]MCX7971805.1 MarC family protein [bacterium]MDW8194919.1 MarC family protein [Candidatus Calescibacterium sp.]